MYRCIQIRGNISATNGEDWIFIENRSPRKSEKSSSLTKRGGEKQNPLVISQKTSFYAIFSLSAEEVWGRKRPQTSTLFRPRLRNEIIILPFTFIFSRIYFRPFRATGGEKNFIGGRARTQFIQASKQRRAAIKTEMLLSPFRLYYFPRIRSWVEV